LRAPQRRVALSILIFSTIVFGINTFDVISLFSLISKDLNADVSSLGLISATMVIGIGVFQIPNGIVAAKFGPKRTTIIGMIIIASGSILVGISDDINQIALFRFVLGGGLAFFFPSAIVIAADSSRKGSEALGVGTVTGSNAAGGLLGLIAWAMFSTILGWRTSIILGGILALVAAIALLSALHTTGRPPIRLTIKSVHLRKVLFDKSLIIMGLLLLGSQVTLEQTLAFMPFYLQSSIGEQLSIAGLVGSLTLLSALVGAPSIGWLYDKGYKFTRLVVIFGALLLAGVSMNFINTLYAAIISTLVVGFSGGGLFALFSNAGRERAAKAAALGVYPEQYATLSVNWIHCIALTGTFWAPLLFSWSAIQSGYSFAWPLIGLVSFSIVITSLLIATRKEVITRRT
jgi:MFS family permease